MGSLLTDATTTTSRRRRRRQRRLDVAVETTMDVDDSVDVSDGDGDDHGGDDDEWHVPIEHEHAADTDATMKRNRRTMKGLDRWKLRSWVSWKGLGGIVTVVLGAVAFFVVTRSSLSGGAWDPSSTKLIDNTEGDAGNATPKPKRVKDGIRLGGGDHDDDDDDDICRIVRTKVRQEGGSEMILFPWQEYAAHLAHDYDPCRDQRKQQQQGRRPPPQPRCRCRSPLKPTAGTHHKNWDEAFVANQQRASRAVSEQRATVVNARESGSDMSSVPPFDVVLLGDSMVEHWLGLHAGRFGTYGTIRENVAVYEEIFPTNETATLVLGISGDRTENLLYRLEREVVTPSVRAAVYWLVIGIKDVNADGCSSQNVVAGIILIVERLLEAAVTTMAGHKATVATIPILQVHTGRRWTTLPRSSSSLTRYYRGVLPIVDG